MALDLLERLGRRLRDLRKECDLTQEELAERAEISWHFLSSIERGQKGATVETLLALAKALDMSLSELFLDVDRGAPKEAKRLGSVLAGRSPEAQRTILAIVEQALRLAGHK
jgi:transcriptional regulator with XRE-family HTH domain